MICLLLERFPGWTLEYVGTLTPLQVDHLFVGGEQLEKARKDNEGTKEGKTLTAKEPKKIIDQLANLPGGLTKIRRVKKKWPKPKKKKQ